MLSRFASKLHFFPVIRRKPSGPNLMRTCWHPHSNCLSTQQSGKKIIGSLDRKDPWFSWSPWSPWSSQIEPMSQQLSRTQRNGLNGLGQLGRVGHSWSIVLNRKWSDSASLAPPSTSTPCFMRRCSLLRQSIAWWVGALVVGNCQSPERFFPLWLQRFQSCVSHRWH